MMPGNRVFKEREKEAQAEDVEWAKPTNRRGLERVIMHAREADRIRREESKAATSSASVKERKLAYSACVYKRPEGILTSHAICRNHRLGGGNSQDVLTR